MVIHRCLVLPRSQYSDSVIFNVIKSNWRMKVYLLVLNEGEVKGNSVFDCIDIKC